MLMKNCAVAKKNTTCDLPSETEGTNEQAPAVAYCKQCFQIAFRCACGHWNRAFARFCTQCPQELKKPATWDMASANPQRTAILSQESSVDSLDVNYGFGSWAAGIPEIEQREDLPKLLAIDGLIIIPNTGSNSLDVYSIVKHEDERYLNLQWSIELNTPLTQGSTPIYHGLHLYTVVSGGIQKTNVFDGKTELININDIDTSKINPIPTCAPLKLNIGSRPTMVAGLDQGMLLFDLNSHNADYIEDMFFDKKNGPLSPVLCGSYIVFISLQGKIYTLNIEDNSRPQRPREFNNIWFSAPVTLESLVYFEVLDTKGNRAIVSYEPVSNELSKVVDVGNDDDLDRRLSFYIHPMLTDGERLFVADRYGRPFYKHQGQQNILGNLNTNGSDQYSLVPHRSVVVNNRIYSAHSTGLSVYSQDQYELFPDRSLAMGWADNPLPIAPPIQYGSKLFVLCQDRLVCLDI